MASDRPVSLLRPHDSSSTPSAHLVRLGAAVSGAALWHALLVAGTVFVPRVQAPPARRPPPVTAQLRRLSGQQWSANRGARSAAPLERPVTRPTGQVVDVAAGNARPPPQSKYLATTDNRVDRETRAAKQTNRFSVARPTTSPKPEQEAAARGSREPSAAPPPSGIDLSQSVFGARRPPPTLFPSSLPQTSGDGRSTQTEGTATGTGSASSPDEGGGAPNDALDAPEGEGTYLNTRQWQFASFFNRVKQAVAAKWDPNGRLRARQRALGSLRRVTVMRVALRADGTMADCFVVRPSGLDELDAEAMQAFHRAAPFLNPPAALVTDGHIVFEFSFEVTDETLRMPLPLRFQ